MISKNLQFLLMVAILIYSLIIGHLFLIILCLIWLIKDYNDCVKDDDTDHHNHDDFPNT